MMIDEFLMIFDDFCIPLNWPSQTFLSDHRFVNVQGSQAVGSAAAAVLACEAPGNGYVLKGKIGELVGG